MIKPKTTYHFEFQGRRRSSRRCYTPPLRIFNLYRLLKFEAEGREGNIMRIIDLERKQLHMLYSHLLA
jgi:hypothetical protein